MTTDGLPGAFEWPHQPPSGDLGYNFHPAAYPHAPGGNQLVVQIHDRPTYHHFDPEHVLVSIWTDDDYPDSLTLRHPWTFGEHYRGYPGRIHMIDRIGEEAHAFSFGGQWQVDNQENVTCLTLVSSAPILDCNQPDSLATFLADEVEVLMAEQRALRRALRISSPPDRQACDPFLVYAASLRALARKYERLEAANSPALIAFHQFLETEIAVLSELGQMPVSLPELDCLF